MREPEMQDWVSKSKPEEKRTYPLSQEMELAIDRFFFSHYCQAFRTGAFARANCSMCVPYLLFFPPFISLWHFRFLLEVNLKRRAIS